MLVLVALVLAAAGCTVQVGGRPRQDVRPEPRDPYRPVIRVASFDFDESQVLAELYAQALERHGYPVRRILCHCPREIIEPALQQDMVDFVPEYSGSALDFLSGRRAATADPAATAAALRRALAARGIVALAYAPAQDANAYAVYVTTAQRYNLRRLSDLRRVAPRLVFGGPPECPERPLCLKGLQETYHLRFKEFEPMSSRAVTAEALRVGEIDVGMLETTNANVADSSFVLLDDDWRLQPAENVIPVLRRDVLAAYGQRLARLVDGITSQLTITDLRTMNRRIAVEGATPATVAGDWLRQHGFET